MGWAVTADDVAAVLSDAIAKVGGHSKCELARLAMQATISQHVLQGLRDAQARVNAAMEKSMRQAGERAHAAQEAWDEAWCAAYREAQERHAKRAERIRRKGLRAAWRAAQVNERLSQ